MSHVYRRPSTTDAAGHTTDDDVVDAAVAAIWARAGERAGHTAEFLDEIGACLEENGPEVVRRFVQRGAG